MNEQNLQNDLQQYRNNVQYLETILSGLALVQDYLNSNQPDYLPKAIQHFRTLQSGIDAPFTMNGITNETQFRQRVINLTNILHNRIIHFETLITQTENQMFQNLNLELGGQITFPQQLFGKKKNKIISLQKKVMRLKHKKGITLKQAWNIVKKQENKKLKLMSLKKLRHLANKKNISITKKNSKKLVNKNTLIKRIKKNKFGETCQVEGYRKNMGSRTLYGLPVHIIGPGDVSNYKLLLSGPL